MQRTLKVAGFLDPLAEQPGSLGHDREIRVVEIGTEILHVRRHHLQFDEASAPLLNTTTFTDGFLRRSVSSSLSSMASPPSPARAMTWRPG
jgi:hypothetical protein